MAETRPVGAVDMRDGIGCGIFMGWQLRAANKKGQRCEYREQQRFFVGKVHMCDRIEN